MWLFIGKSLLVMFLVVGVAFYVVTFIRKSRTVESRPDPNGYLAHFNRPTLTPPEWVNWTEGDEQEDAGNKRGQPGQ
jgi:hypothetical protein